MPKKQPRNAFFFFMMDFKEQQRKEGMVYSNNTEVSNAAGPAWSLMTQAQKAKFEEMARREKQKYNVPDMKFTSTGIPLSEIQRRQEEEQRAQQAELKGIKNIVSLNVMNKKITTIHFFLMDVNCYCVTPTNYVIAESSLLRFNFADGILDDYHELINPGKVPLGYMSDAKHSCEELGLELPDETRKISNNMQILGNIMDYMKSQSDNAGLGNFDLPPIFTMPDKVPAVTNFLQDMCDKAGQDVNIFRVYKLDLLFFHLRNGIIQHPDDKGFPKESLALSQLNQDTFKYSVNIACNHHETVDKAVECTMSRTKRWAYTILDFCCPVLDIPVEAGKHLPADLDVQSIQAYREEQINKNNRNVVASLRFNSSSDFNSTNDMSAETVENVPHNRSHVPLRTPKVIWNMVEDANPAPELNTSSSRSLGAGRGRGMGITYDMSKMNLRK